uniref:Uncharacterized protein n=1 Tax=Cacopsylla melanoneura TaxID=428564 RepID=A0A8D9EDQ7_9HEMI
MVSGDTLVPSGEDSLFSVFTRFDERSTNQRVSPSPEHHLRPDHHPGLSPYRPLRRTPVHGQQESHQIENRHPGVQRDADLRVLIYCLSEFRKRLQCESGIVHNLLPR